MLRGAVCKVVTFIRVAWGALILDALDPRWVGRVDTETLDMSVSASCVVGQVLGGVAGYFTEGSRVLDGADPKTPRGIRIGTRRGFLSSRFSSWEDLNQAWKFQINYRLKAART